MGKKVIKEVEFSELENNQQDPELNALKNHIAQASKDAGHKTGNKKLIFSESGELILGVPTSNSDVVVDQIYKDGFFNAN